MRTADDNLFKLLFFPLFQLALLALLLFVVWRDYRPLIPGGISATVRRGPESMSALEKITGLVIAAIITVINKSVFDDNEAGWRHYSAAINAFDLIAISIFVTYHRGAAIISLGSTSA